MQIAGGQKHVNPRLVGKLNRSRRHLDIFFFGACQGCDPRLAHRLRNRGNGCEITL